MTRSEILDLEYQRLKDTFLELWNLDLELRAGRKQIAILLFADNTWPDDMRDVIVRIRFLNKAIKEAYDYVAYTGRPPNTLCPWLFDGLFRGRRWLWERTWAGVKSGAEIYGYAQGPGDMPKKFRAILERML